MKTHYYPPFLAGDEEAERGPCGVWLGETSKLNGTRRAIVRAAAEIGRGME